MKVEYGIMSSKWSIEAEDKLTAYATILMSMPYEAKMIALYTEECKQDSWLFAEDLEKRIGEIFGGSISDFRAYVDAHIEDIRKANKTIKKLV